VRLTPICFVMEVSRGVEILSEHMFERP
jgi:hypothetical protein